MNILFITRWFPGKERPSSGIFIQEHASCLANYHNIKVLIYKNSKKQNRFIEMETDKKSRFEITYLSLKPILNSDFILRLWGTLLYLKKQKEKEWIPDIIQANIFSTALPVVILKKIHKIPVVIMEHFSKVALNLLSKKERLILKFVYDFSDGVITVSNNLKDKIIHNYKIKNRIYVIPNVVDTRLFYPSRKKYQRKFIKILAVSSLRKIKGLEYLLESISIIKRNDFILNIAGEGEEKRNLLKLCKKLNIEERIKFLGHLPKKRIASLMKDSDFFVLSSIWENLPCVIIEALASGLPVVATEVGGVPELINKNNGILVPPADSKKLATAIEFMLKNYKNFSKERIAESARKSFSCKAVARRFTITYQKVINEKKT